MLIRLLYRALIVTFYKLFIPVKIIGRENMPSPDAGPLIIIANHFSIFDVPLMGYWLPAFPTFFASAELWENGWLAPGLNAMSADLIKLKRGVVDRDSLKKGLDCLANGGWLMLFPEGGVTPESIALSAGGSSTADQSFGLVRAEPVLLPPRPGAALLATHSGAQVLPIGIHNSHLVLQNLRRLRRTPVEIHIGRPAGPFKLDPSLGGAAKREKLDEIGEELMLKIEKQITKDSQFDQMSSI